MHICIYIYIYICAFIYIYTYKHKYKNTINTIASMNMCIYIYIHDMTWGALSKFKFWYVIMFPSYVLELLPADPSDTEESEEEFQVGCCHICKRSNLPSQAV